MFTSSFERMPYSAWMSLSSNLLMIRLSVYNVWTFMLMNSISFNHKDTTWQIELKEVIWLSKVVNHVLTQVVSRKKCAAPLGAALICVIRISSFKLDL